MFENNLTALSQKVNELEKQVLSNKTIFNLTDLCNFTGLSKSHIYKLTCWGKIPYYKQAKHLFFDRVEIENWLKENRFDVVNTETQAANYCLTNKRRG
jgi:predicted DNA-binding transcriptional regulator AlpA